MRNVGEESRKTWQEKHNSGFFKKYMSPHGIEIGYKGYLPDVVPILPNCKGIDLDYPGYDGKTLPFKDNSEYYVYSSHCLEHINDYKQSIQEWYRVCKPKGHIIIVVPHRDLYEKKLLPPSKWNEDHKHFFTPAKLLQYVEESLLPNSYRIRLLQDEDVGFTYDIGPDKHSGGCYEITLVIQKIERPSWEIK